MAREAARRARARATIQPFSHAPEMIFLSSMVTARPSPLLSALLLAAGCTLPAPPPATPSDPAPPATTAPATPPPPSSSATPTSSAPAAPATASSLPPLAEPLPPLARPLLPVHLIKMKAGIVHIPDGGMRQEWADLPPASILSIHGRNPRDVWLLTEDQTVLHDDGTRILDRYPRPCGWGQAESGVGARLEQILVDKEGVRVLGESRDAFSRLGGDLTAVLTPSAHGKWACQPGGVAPALTSSTGDYTWKLKHNLVDGACRLRASEGRCAPIPAWAPSFREPSGDAIDSGIHSTALQMRGFDDGWIVTLDDQGCWWLLRYNGVAWLPVAELERGTRIMDLWVDGEGHPWITARRGGGAWNDPADAVYRHDGHALRELPVPASFTTRLVRGTGPRDVWFAGAGGKIYQWDGEKLRQGVAPFDATDAWSSPGGEVWIVGKGGAARTAPLAEVR